MTELKTNTRTWLFAGALLLAGIANLLSNQKRLQMQALRASTKCFAKRSLIFCPK